MINESQARVVQENCKSGDGKAPYTSPVFRIFGSVSKLTRNTGTVNGDSGPQSMAPSDPLVKEHILRIGEHPLGVGLYLFDYKPGYQERCGYGRQFGVMADEVEAVVPDAVSVHPDGYKMVNYTMLGISHRLQ